MAHHRRAVSIALMLLVLVGHDALMAANPHAQDMVHSSAAGGGHSTLTATCLTSDGVQTPSLDLPIPAISNGVMFIAVAIPLCREMSRISWRSAPDHPPDVRRALLQVFLN